MTACPLRNSQADSYSLILHEVAKVSELSEERDPVELEPTRVPRERPRYQMDSEAIPYTIDLASCAMPVDWGTIFGNEHPIELEVGSGKGLFLTNAATRDPACNFFGIELARKYAAQAAERIAKRRLSNVKILPGDALNFLARYVPPRSVRVVHVYFPDPWWKKRHRKRRVFNEGLVASVERALVPRGELSVVTDVEEYFGVICELMATRTLFEEVPLNEPKTPEHDQDYLTNFERKYRIEGRPIYRKLYRLR